MYFRYRRGKNVTGNKVSDAGELTPMEIGREIWFQRRKPEVGSAACYILVDYYVIPEMLFRLFLE